jgi:hypothetical protein
MPYPFNPPLFDHPKKFGGAGLLHYTVSFNQLLPAFSLLLSNPFTSHASRG